MPDPNVVREYRKEIRAAKSDIKEMTDLSAVLNGQTRDLSKAQIKTNQNLSKYLDVSIQAAKQGKLSLDQLKSRTQLIEDIASGENDIDSIKLKQRNIEAEILKVRKNYYGKNKEIGKLKEKELQKDLEMLKAEEQKAKAAEVAKGVSGALSDLTGGMSSQAEEFADNWDRLGPSTALTLVGIAAFAAMLKSFSDQVDAIGEKFGAIGVQEFSKDLMAADIEMQALGYDAGTSSDMAQQLADNFGMTFSEAVKLTPEIADMSKALGMSVEEGGAFVGQMTQITGMSAQAAIDLAKMTEQLAKSNGVAPGSVMRDIAVSSETMAKFTDGTGENMVKAAIQAKKLGTNLDTVAGIAEGLLDFQSSIQKEMEASIITGKNLNLQKARELALNNDIEGMMEEVVNQLGSEAEWNKMNFHQRQALADALNTDVGTMSKLVAGTKEQVTLAGELEKQEGFGDLVGAEAMSSLAELMGSLKAIGAELTIVFGPALDFITGIFTNLAKQLKENKVLMTILKVVVGALGAKLLWMGISAIWSGAFSALGWIPVVGPILATIAAGVATAAILSAVGSAATAGDMSMQAGKAPMVSTNVGAFQLDKRDDLVAGPGVVDALDGGEAAGGVPVINVDVTPVVTAIGALQMDVQTLSEDNVKLRSDMKGYFGVGGTLAKQVGKKTISAINDQA